MDKKIISKEKIISMIRARIDGSTYETTDRISLSDHELAVLLGELQVFQMELEMQNEELAASRQMVESERSKFADFFNLAPVSYFVIDQLGLVEEVNEVGTDLLLIDKHDLIGGRFQKFIDPEAWEHFYAFLHQMHSTSKKQSCEIKLVTKERTTVYARIEGKAVRRTTEATVQYYLTVIDITDNRIAQQNLIGTTKRLEVTLGASDAGTWTLNLDSQQLFLDDFSFKVLQIKPWSFDGTLKNFSSIIHPEDQNWVLQQLRSVMTNPHDLDIGFKIINDVGEIRFVTMKGKQVLNTLGNDYLAGMVMDVTERTKAAEAAVILEQEHQKLIISSAFDAQERERHKIGNALHDSVCQVLYGIRMNVKNLVDQHKLGTEFNHVNRLLDQVIREIRALSYELTPSVLLDFGFSAGLQEMANRLSNDSFEIRTSINKGADKLDQSMQLYAFRILQELLNNSIKHAKARNAEIIVCTENGLITLICRDNGKGFETGVEDALKKGSGLRAIKNRVYLLKGEITFDTSSEGTVVKIIIKNNPETTKLIEN